MGGLLGVGGRFIVAPILMELGDAPKRAAATTSAIVTSVSGSASGSASGFLAHAAEGRMEPALTALTLIAAIAGSRTGAWLMLPPGTLKEHWPLEDPARAGGDEEEILKAFRASRDEIRARVADLIKRCDAETEEEQQP